MDPKYSNIFWHQGVKLFEEKVLKGRKGQIRVAHLENDVTKALLNLFEHCSPKVLKAFLQMVGVKQVPKAFALDFQVTDTAAYRKMSKRMMLSIVAASTQIRSNETYKAMKSIPDACIYSLDTAILIESKTQSPLIQEQLQGHIKHFFGSATHERVITWEDISEKFRLLSRSLKDLDRFLVDQFCAFLDLIGISEFSGFSELDFAMLGWLGKISDEDYTDFKRLFHRKITRFMEHLKTAVEPTLRFKKYNIYISKLPTQSVGTHSGFYFYDADPKIHINPYPNININYREHCIDLNLNSETRASVKPILGCLINKPQKLEAVLDRIGKIQILFFYKMQYLPMDNFVWDVIPGFPKNADTFKSANVLEELHDFETQWPDYKHSILYQMESGRTRHSSGRLFNETEISYARSKNPRPNYDIRFGWQYPADKIAGKKKQIIPFFKKEIAKLKPLVELILK